MSKQPPSLFSEAPNNLEAGIFSSIINNLPVAVFAKDADDDFKIILWNKKQEEITQVPSGEALGFNDHNLHSQHAADAFRVIDEAVIKNNETHDIPLEVIRIKGHPTVYLHTTKVPVIKNGRNIIIGICEDITDAFLRQKQLKKLNRHLDEKSEELESTQQQLIQAEKLESIGRLAAGVAHEVKNPLNLLTQGLDYLSNLEAPDGQPEDETTGIIINEMKEAISRAEEIVKGLLDFSSSRQTQKEAHNPVDIIERVLVMIRHEINKQSVEVVREYESDPMPILVDKGKFEQVILNTLMNAIHAMENSTKPQLTIRVKNKKITLGSDEGNRTAQHLRNGDDVVAIELYDNGTGIDPDHLDKIFDPFFTTKATGEGTGLGLSIVRKIVALHQGKIALQNLPDNSGVLTHILMPAATT